MSYYDIRSLYDDRSLERLFNNSSRQAAARAISSDDVTVEQFASLLSGRAEDLLEDMARRAHEITLRYFGRTIQLYTPLYISNHCENTCVYCGFNADNSITRRRLTLDEVKDEAEAVVRTGLKHILVLTGDSTKDSPVSYIRDCVRILRNYFSSISIEIYALTENEYAGLVSEGVDGLTIYQETYDEALYAGVHPLGPKSDYKFRLDAPERGARAGIRSINIGVLFGLGDFRREAFLMGLHARYLQDNFPGVDIGASIPRLRPHTGKFDIPHEVTDKNLVQVITALRIFLPRLSIAVSTREKPLFRERIMPLGITRMSAGSTTRVGGRAVVADDDACQFAISDERSVAEIKEMLEDKGYQPVMKDWMQLWR